ncbi:DEAD/DEAH box helicase [Calidifontibacter sp. DB0510]|uniref:DEAD/DEAH box helicase n=1 Tax=Metallococcus carri TaxID=1656884 RepID=A0A967B0Z5_9MICO|nr:DEAD/DEAH box helicase [Metallococcus carri]NHN56303.1 DEAD/DEAH box helicase [Metallococcus carri]NOP38645.1 DEAD/DEAH box helicase [Calidifontibacter sp. DB2511S]
MPASRYHVRGAEWLRGVSDADLIVHIGDLAFERALGYADAERVESINTGDGGRMVLATVAGGRDRPYSSLLTIPYAGAGPQQWTSRCSCPMQERCKHVGAMVLTAREFLGGGNATAERSWLEFSDRFLRPEPSAPAGEQLGLRFALTRPTWMGPGRKPVARIAIRPTRHGKGGRWIRQMSWREVTEPGWGWPPRSYDEAQHAAVMRLMRRWQLLSPAYLRATETVHLDELGPEVWDDLDAAVRAGVVLLGDTDNEPGAVTLTVGEPTPAPEFTATDDGGLTGRLQLPGFDGAAHWQGDPAHGLVVSDDDRLRLIGFERALTPFEHWLMQQGELAVPPEHAEDFRQVHLPRLRGLDIRPADAEPLRLRLHVTQGAGLGLRVSTGFRYAADRVVDTALGTGRFGRDRVAERELVERVADDLRDLGLVEPIGGLGYWPVSVVEFDGPAAVAFQRRLPDLLDHPDLEVQLDDELPAYEEVDEAPRVSFEADDDGNDWFDLRVSVTVGDEQVPFEPLFAALARGEEVMVLESGTWFSLDQPEFTRLRELIEESRSIADRPRDTVRVSRYDVDWWAELDGLGEAVGQAAGWRARVATLTALDDAPAPPASLRARLRPYQEHGYGWLTGLWDAGLGGVLADDMGLGKTIQALAMLARAHERGELTEPVLVVAPSSVVGTWVHEAATFAPELRVVAIPRTSATRGGSLAELIAGAQLVVTSYTVLRLDAEDYGEIRWRAVILDEAQQVKNHRSKTFQVVHRLSRPFTLVVTGTPLENSLMDLWAMFALAAPGLLSRPDRFSQQWRRPIEGGDTERLQRLNRRIRPLMLRRTKEVVAADLPPKQIQVQEVPLTPRHRAVYDRHLQRERQRVLGLLEDPEANRIAILASLTRLRQLALDPRLIEPEYAARELPAKLAFLVEHLRELEAGGHRALVFSQFTGYLALVREALDAAGISWSYLDGSTTNRQAVIDGFKQGDSTAFLISLKAGGVGLTLTEADYVFVLDPWWNPAAEAQAIDRAHRIGQDQPVMVYRMVSEGTIEQKVVALQQAKRDLFDRVVEGAGATGERLDADDIRALLTDD